MSLTSIVKVIETPFVGYEDLGLFAGRTAAKVMGYSTPKAKQTNAYRQALIVSEAANKYHINPSILWGVYGRETSHGSNITASSTGAQGPFQFEPATAKQYGYPIGANTNGVTNYTAFRKQAEAAAHLLAASGGKEAEAHAGTPAWRKHWEEAIAAYNTGSRQGKPEYSFAQVIESGKSLGGPGAAYTQSLEQQSKEETAEHTYPTELSPTSKFSEIGVLLILVLAGAFLLIYGLAIAVRPKERAMSNPFPAMKGTVLAGLGGYGGYGGA